MNVFGPFFDDKKPRCGDCYAARFWRGAVGLTVIIGAAIALLSALQARPSGVVAGIAIAALFGTLSWRRARTFDRTAPLPKS